MFEAAEIGQTINKDEFKLLEPEIHQQLLALQQILRKTSRSLIVIVAGVEGAGKGEVVDRLHRWFDTRDVQTHAYWDATDEERQRPRFWRFWRTLPARGTVSVMFGSWYTAPIVDAAFDRITKPDFEKELRKISELEKTLTDDGAIIVKLWFHLPKAEQKHRLHQDAENIKFKNSPILKEFAKSYDKFVLVSEQALRLTDTGYAPWHIIESTDIRFRDVTVGNALIAALENALPAPAEIDSEIDSEQQAPALHAGVSTTLSPVQLKVKQKSVLDTVNLDLSLTAEDYGLQIVQEQQRLYKLAWEMNRQKRNAIILFEGWDAAGKGSAIRRVTAAMDARLYRVIPVAAPTDEEKAHHYLWRFWRHIPRAGYMTIYDRSWYGRVLVERVEGFATPAEWQRAYGEINDFEMHLVSHGIALCKFWIHISADEQLRRFKERAMDSNKNYKLTDDDWRNREQWQAYSAAVSDMVAHTSTARTPWTLVAGNDKLYARIQILKTVSAALEATLDASHAAI